MSEQYTGVIPVNKPAGWTSHDVVAKARRLLCERRIGHTGTLDPAVTGVLPLCVGRATRLVDVLQERPKEYEAELTIGYATDTEDATGREIARTDRAAIDRDLLLRAFARYTGVIEQVPPMYSAVKVDGKRLYELAREGVQIERKPRTVTVHSIELLAMDESGRWPTVRFRARCSKGTYIRTLCVDIGRALGYPAVMSGLLRTEAGGIRLEACFGIDELERMAGQGTIGQALIPLDRAVAFLPAVTLDDEAAAKALNGVPVRLPDSAAEEERQLPGQAAEVRIHNRSGAFIGLFRWDPTARMLAPSKVFPPGSTEQWGR